MLEIMRECTVSCWVMSSPYPALHTSHIPSRRWVIHHPTRHILEGVFYCVQNVSCHGGGRLHGSIAGKALGATGKPFWGRLGGNGLILITMSIVSSWVFTVTSRMDCSRQAATSLWQDSRARLGSFAVNWSAFYFALDMTTGNLPG